jgi:hypothetical protein
LPSYHEVEDIADQVSPYYGLVVAQGVQVKIPEKRERTIIEH